MFKHPDGFRFDPLWDWMCSSELLRSNRDEAIRSAEWRTQVKYIDLHKNPSSRTDYINRICCSNIRLHSDNGQLPYRK